MGKRSTTSTKSGKFMNPTDQARKEARKRELKKNKKQRLAVRAAVLKGKNPRDIVAELEKLDDMEFNVLAPPPLNDKVLKDKRRKLHETWQRVMRMYEKEDVEQYVELKRLWHSYQNRKHEVVTHFEAVKNAQNVTPDEIPLPTAAGPEGSGGDGATESIPLPPSALLKPKSSILKKPSVLESLKPKTCPGVPAGPPPLLSEYDDSTEDGFDKENSAKLQQRSKKIRFDDEDDKQLTEDDVVAPGEETGPQVDEIQRKMLLMAGQDVDQYMKEMEEVHRQTQAEKAVELQNRLARIDGGKKVPDQGGSSQPAPPGIGERPREPPPGAPARNLFMPPGAHPAMIPPRPPILFRPAPPPLRPGMAPSSVRLPPGPPPGRPPAPPGPPPGRPPMGMMAAAVAAAAAAQSSRAAQGGVVSAAPQLLKEGKSTAGQSVIEAKPQMRNLKSDITRFVPTNVKIKRDVGPGAKKRQSDPLGNVFRGHPQPTQPKQTMTKDDAYTQFMKEMDQLMK